MARSTCSTRRTLPYVIQWAGIAIRWKHDALKADASVGIRKDRNHTPPSGGTQSRCPRGSRLFLTEQDRSTACWSNARMFSTAVVLCTVATLASAATVTFQPSNTAACPGPQQLTLSSSSADTSKCYFLCVTEVCSASWFEGLPTDRVACSSLAGWAIRRFP